MTSSVKLKLAVTPPSLSAATQKVTESSLGDISRQVDLAEATLVSTELPHGTPRGDRTRSAEGGDLPMLREARRGLPRAACLGEQLSWGLDS